MGNVIEELLIECEGGMMDYKTNMHQLADLEEAQVR